MKQPWLLNTVKIATLFLVGALLIGHGTRSKTDKYEISWHELSTARLSFDLTAQTPERRFLVEVRSENYLPPHDGLPLWEERLAVQGIQGTTDPALIYVMTNTAAQERYHARSFYIQHVSRRRHYVMASAPRPPSENKYLPIVASCRQKTCTASSILTIRRAPEVKTAVQHISLEYIADLMGPPYCSNCKLERRPRKPGGAKISLRLTEM
jgi:hypothetical protein